MPNLSRLARTVLLLTGCCVIVLANGCGKKSAQQTAAPVSAAASQTDPVSPDVLLKSAVDLLQQSQDSMETQQVSTKDGIVIQLNPKYKHREQNYAVAAQFLNHYLTTAQAAGNALIDPLDDDVRTTLADRLSKRQMQQLESQQFDRHDALHLESCFTHRDIAERVTAGMRDDRVKAETLFDWVIRNVQLVPPDASPVRVASFWTLLRGRGTELERAWTFTELLRQVNIESVLLAYVEPDPDTKEPRYVPWLPAALIDESLYLFDTTLGLPVPGPGGQGVATIQQVLEHPALLEGLALDEEHPYRVRSEHLEKLARLYESSPAYWAPKMRFLQEQLSGRNRVVLWSDLQTLARRTRIAVGRELPQDLWELPASVEENTRSSQAYADQLAQLFSPYFVLEGLSDKASERRRANLRNQMGDTGLIEVHPFEARRAHLRGHFDVAIPLYVQNRSPQPMLANQGGPIADFLNRVREDSTYFLGLAKFEERKYDQATTWFGKSYLERYPEGVWAAGARYNLGRCAETLEDTAKAIENYTAENAGPQLVGNLIRARRLGWKPESAAPAAQEPASN